MLLLGHINVEVDVGIDDVIAVIERVHQAHQFASGFDIGNVYRVTWYVGEFGFNDFNLGIC
jgi:hypothetical protein